MHTRTTCDQEEMATNIALKMDMSEKDNYSVAMER